MSNKILKGKAWPSVLLVVMWLCLHRLNNTLQEEPYKLINHNPDKFLCQCPTHLTRLRITSWQAQLASLILLIQKLWILSSSLVSVFNNFRWKKTLMMDRKVRQSFWQKHFIETNMKKFIITIIELSIMIFFHTAFSFNFFFLHHIIYYISQFF